MWREPLSQTGSALLFASPTNDVEAIADELTDAGWLVARSDCAGASDKATFINAIAGALRFPEWTGRNWDALHDSLTDLGWLDATSIALVLDGVAPFRKASPGEWDTARGLMVEAAEWWQEHEKTLIVIVA